MKAIPTKFAIYHSRQLYQHLDDPGGEYLNSFIELLGAYHKVSTFRVVDFLFFLRTLRTAIADSGYEPDDVIWVNFIDPDRVLQALEDYS